MTKCKPISYAIWRSKLTQNCQNGTLNTRYAKFCDECALILCSFFIICFWKGIEISRSKVSLGLSTRNFPGILPPGPPPGLCPGPAGRRVGGGAQSAPSQTPLLHKLARYARFETMFLLFQTQASRVVAGLLLIRHTSKRSKMTKNPRHFTPN